MIDRNCLGSNVDPSKVSPDAEVSGASYVTGGRTIIGPGAVVRDSRVHDARVEGGASVVDSILIAEGSPHRHKCDAAGRTVSGAPDQPSAGAGASISGCTLINVSVGAASRIAETFARDCSFGDHNDFGQAKCVLVTTGSHVRVSGPTELSEAWLGHHATIDRRGYFEGVFSNRFHKLRFDPAAGRLAITETIDLPHVSRYGVNTVNSTNSGKLLPREGGVLEGLGAPEGLWRDNLLSHEQIELSPCCWVCPWTKVVGQSPLAHADDAETVNDPLMTCLMPFAVAGFGGGITRGLVAPGELSNGLGPSERVGGWAFTYAPGAVIAMVARLREALPPDRRAVADTIVIDAVETAVEMTRAAAFERGVDVSVPLADQRPGWPRRIAADYALLKAHLDGDLWRFEGGRPVEWRREAGRWTHPRIGAVLAVAGDALSEQVDEERLLDAGAATEPERVRLPSPKVAGAAAPPEISPDAQVAASALVRPGCRIGPGSVVEAEAVLWNSVIEGGHVGAGAIVERATVRNATIGADSVVRSSSIADSRVGARSLVEAAEIVGSQLSDRTTVSAFGQVRGVRADFGTILGGAFGPAKIETHLMSMHLAGSCRHLHAMATPVHLDGGEVLVPAVPMIGGGAVVRGSSEMPVEMECCFIGSNAIVEAGTFVGFGCFVLGTLGLGEGLLPFTVSTGGGAEKHKIGAVLGSLASTVITHFVNWTYQAVGQAGAEAVAQLVPRAIGRGIEAIEWELARRSGAAGGEEGGDAARFARYRSLPAYSEAQLASGLTNYRRALESGAWEMVFENGQLRFASAGGQWLERDGSAMWRKKPAAEGSAASL
jgi:hypothetical protein